MMKFRFHLSRLQMLVAGLVMCVVAAAASYFWATAMLDSVYAYRSPLKDAPPQPGAALGQPATRKVVFVLVDGLRLDVSQMTGSMPNLNRLRQQGAAATMHSQAPSYSQAGYTTLLTGGWPDLNDGPAANLDYADIPTWTQDNLFSAAQRAGLKTAVSGYNWFEKLIPQAAVSASFYTPGEDQAADRAVVDAALPWLSQDYTLVLIHIDQVDYAGHHEGGPLSPAGIASARRSDELLGEILARVDLSKDTVLVASDHGHIEPGGHGGIESVVLTEPFVLAGAGVKPGSYPDLQMVDVAPTLAALLGTSLPASSQGGPLAAMLNLPAATQAGLGQAVAAQQTGLVTAYTAAIGRPITANTTGINKVTSVAELMKLNDDVASFQKFVQNARGERLFQEQIPRGVTILFLLLVIVGLYSRSKPRFLAWTFGGALLSIAIFHLRYALLDGHAYSISWVTGQTDLIVYIAVTTAVGLAAGWLVTLYGLGALRRDRAGAAAATLGYLLAIFTCLGLIAGVDYTINGFTPTWTLPAFIPYFLTLLSLIEALVSGALGLALIGVSAWIGRR